MPEIKNNPNYQPLLDNRREAKKTDDQENIEKQNKLFEVLDEFGEIGAQLLSELYRKNLPDDLTQDNIMAQPEVTFKTEEFEALSDQQKQFLLNVLSQLKFDNQEVMKKIGNKDKEELLKQLFNDLNFAFQKENIKACLEKIAISLVPGGIAILVKDRKYFESLFPSHTTNGFYIRSEKYDNLSVFPGQILVIDATRLSAKKTFRHEYLHLLTANYIEPFEISKRLPKEAKILQKEIGKLEELILGLDEEMEYVKSDEAIIIQQEISKLRKKILALQENIDQLIDATENYLTDEAQNLFLDIRDELSAYAVGEKFNTNLELLMPRGVSWEKRLDAIKHKQDKEKITNQWSELKKSIDFCSRAGIPANAALPIFLTSQNFEQMAKRLNLLIRERAKNN